MLKQQLGQKLQQRISPQQIQLIKLMELPTLELEERIKHELEENPALEEDAAVREEEKDEIQDNTIDEDLLLGDYLREDDIPDYKLQEVRNILRMKYLQILLYHIFGKNKIKHNEEYKKFSYTNKM